MSYWPVSCQHLLHTPPTRRSLTMLPKQTSSKVTWPHESQILQWTHSESFPMPYIEPSAIPTIYFSPSGHWHKDSPMMLLKLLSVNVTTSCSSLQIVMCMAWLQAKSQAKPGHTGQAKPKVLAWRWLWPGLDFLKAKANGPGHGFEHYFLKQLPPIIITLTVA